MKSISGLLLCALLLSAGSAPAADSDDDVYKEDAIRHYIDNLPEKAEPKEQKLVIPPWPQEKNLVEIDIGRYGYSFRLLVDTASISVGEDGVVRFTAVLRSNSGVDNVSYEGIRCARQQYKRYAYGSGGTFYPVGAADWKRIHQTRQDIYRQVLADGFFCPVPSGDAAATIVRKLNVAAHDTYPEQE